MTNKKAFTLIEIIVSIVILIIVIIWWFNAYTAVLIWKIKLIEKTDIQKQAFYFSEKFFEELKKWWTIDYEEYFNRKIVWVTTSSGHYNLNTWFWNFWNGWNVENASYWNWHYYCRSWSGSLMWTWWCVSSHNTEWVILTWKPRRYWQYVYQFIDYNYNADWDEGSPWDEDGDWNIIWDYDDEYLWEWPDAFSGSNIVKEIYLISADYKTRTYFRWNIKKDPDTTLACNPNTWSWGCASTIEFLKLEWKDWWNDHNKSGSGLYDWNVDTWLINKDFAWKSNYDDWNFIVAGSDANNYWQPLFWKNINVKNVEFFMYPNKDFKLSWRNVDPKVNIAPYIRLKMTLEPTAIARKWIKWKIPEIEINTTVSLSEIYSKN